MTAKFSASADGSKVNIGNAAEDALQIDSMAKTISALPPYVLQGVPAGAVMDFAMNSAPTGWLACNGALVSRTTYAALFDAIGTTWGAGNGTTTFQLPDMRGYFRRGAGTNSDGAVSGAFATRQAQAIEAHNHTLTMVAGPASGSADGAYRSQTGSPFGAVAGFIGGSQGAETRPRNIAVLTCIKT